MKLGNLFKAVVDTATLPVSLAADVLTIGVSKAVDGEFYVEKKINKIADELNEI